MKDLKLYVENEIQKVLFENELSGQISDGMWENASPFNHWQDITSVEVIVRPEDMGLNFNPVKDNYNLNSKQLLEVIGDRMIDMCNLAHNGITNREIISAVECVGGKIYSMYADHTHGCYEQSSVQVTIDLRASEEEVLEAHRNNYWVKQYNFLIEEFGSPVEVLKALNGPYDLKKLKKELGSLKKIMKLRTV